MNILDQIMLDYIDEAELKQAKEDSGPPEFDTTEDAWDWVHQEIDHDPCVDNHRIAQVDNLLDVANYEQQRRQGCCGFFDTEVIIRNELYKIGCNYGH